MDDLGVPPFKETSKCSPFVWSEQCSKPALSRRRFALAGRWFSLNMEDTTIPYTSTNHNLWTMYDRILYLQSIFYIIHDMILFPVHISIIYKYSFISYVHMTIIYNYSFISYIEYNTISHYISICLMAKTSILRSCSSTSRGWTQPLPQVLVVVVDLRDVNHRRIGPEESPVGQRADDQGLGDRLKCVICV